MTASSITPAPTPADPFWTVADPIADVVAPDPFVCFDAASGWYYSLFTRSTRVEIFRSRDPGRLLADNDSAVVFEVGAAVGIYSCVWAPEMHRAPNGRWYIYTSGNTIPGDTWKLRLFVLESKTSDPFDGFVFKGFPLPGVEAIDPTVYAAPDGRRYLVCARMGGGGESLWMTELENPWTCKSEGVELVRPELDWELSCGHIAEGAFFLENGGRLFLVYSVNDCRADTYSLAIAEHVGGTLMDAANWKKGEAPLLVQSEGIYGPGHASFFRKPNGEIWCAYHARTVPNAGFGKPDSRKFFLRKLNFDAEGRPSFDWVAIRAMPDRRVFVRTPNYDPLKIAPYELEDPLVFCDGRKVADAAGWAERRQEILGIFAREMYGQPPPPPEAVVTELADEKIGAAAGFAVRRQYRMWFKADKSGPCVNWILWLPRYAKNPVPVISFLNYKGNHELVPDADVPVCTAWVRGCASHRSDEGLRGRMQDPECDAVFPLGMILARGYAVMSACYAEISPDPDRAGWADDADKFPQATFAYKGVFDLWGERDSRRLDNPTALGAWGWALSRGLDLAERIPEIDANRSVVTGYSRLGKAALLAAARDERFAVCVPNQTGGGGAPLAKRDYGENVSTENTNFIHWYCPAYAKYAADPARTLFFDQHLLLACVAPRALLVEGFDEPWFDTEGEYLAVKAASPVWEFLKGGGMPNVDFPPDFDTSAIGRHLGYVRRCEKHGISAYDWQWLLDFSDSKW